MPTTRLFFGGFSLIIASLLFQGETWYQGGGNEHISRSVPVVTQERTQTRTSVREEPPLPFPDAQRSAAALVTAQNPFVNATAVTNYEYTAELQGIVSALQSLTSIVAEHIGSSHSGGSSSRGDVATRDFVHKQADRIYDSLGDDISDVRSELTTSGGVSASGSLGQVAYFSDEDTITGTSSIFIASNGKIGIGTTTPTAPLHIATTVSIDGSRIYSGPGNLNVLYGPSAGRQVTSDLEYNTYVGYATGWNNTSGSYNSALGASALLGNSDGSDNVAVGHYALGLGSTGSENTAVGVNALRSVTGDGNVALGMDAGLYVDHDTLNESSSYGVFIGHNAKAGVIGATNQIVIGTDASGSGSNIAVIGSTSITTTRLRGNVNIGTTGFPGTLDVSGTSSPADTTTGIISVGTASGIDDRRIKIGSVEGGYSYVQAYRPLIAHDGVFTINPLGGLVGIGTTTPGETLTVDGIIQASNLVGGTAIAADASGNIILDPSDVRLKTNIHTLEDSLDKVLNLRGVSYEWKDPDRFGTQTEIGFIAQEVDLILPEVVRKGDEYWSLNRANMVAVVVEAIKDMWTRINERFAGQDEEIDALRAEIDALRREVYGTNAPPTVPDEQVVETEDEATPPVTPEDTEGDAAPEEEVADPEPTEEESDSEQETETATEEDASSDVAEEVTTQSIE